MIQLKRGPPDGASFFFREVDVRAPRQAEHKLRGAPIVYPVETKEIAILPFVARNDKSALSCSPGEKQKLFFGCCFCTGYIKSATVLVEISMNRDQFPGNFRVLQKRNGFLGSAKIESPRKNIIQD